MEGIPSAEQALQELADFLRSAGESFLAGCVWLELKLVAAGIDPILVLPLALAVLVYFVLKRPNRLRVYNRRRFRSLWKWVMASPVFLFAGYVLIDEILYWCRTDTPRRLANGPALSVNITLNAIGGLPHRISATRGRCERSEEGDTRIG